MRSMNFFLIALALQGTLFTAPAFAQKETTIKVAAAADLKFAMDEILLTYKRQYPDDKIEVTYGSSGTFATQIEQGAPFDVYFSADISFPTRLAKKGFAGSDVVMYAVGRIVLWSPSLDASKMTLNDLTRTNIAKVAIANPRHAPYGQRAEEAFRSLGIWDQLQTKLVLGENIAHTAQYVQSGAVPIGIIALSLALNPELSTKGSYYLIPDTLHKPLEQGYMITKRAEQKEAAKRFAQYMTSPEARRLMDKYGFVLPKL